MNLFVVATLTTLLCLTPSLARSHSRLTEFKFCKPSGPQQTVDQSINSEKFPAFLTNNFRTPLNRDVNPQSIHCVDENNHPVDWVIFLKLPRVHQSTNPLIVNGEAYMYVTSEDVRRFEERKNVERGNTKKINTEKENADEENTIKIDSDKENTQKDAPINVVEEDNDNNPITQGKNVENSKLSNPSKDIENDSAKENDYYTTTQERNVEKSELSNSKKDIKNDVHEDTVGSQTDTDSSLEQQQIDKRREKLPYYSYMNDDVTNDQQDEAQKILTDKLKVVLMKQFVKDAREQISMESSREVEEQSNLLNELDVHGMVKRNTENAYMENLDYPWDREKEDMYKDLDDNYSETSKIDTESEVPSETPRESPHLEIDFPDSLRLLNNLIKSRTGRGKTIENYGNLNRDNLLEIFHAIELLSENSEHTEEAGHDSEEGRESSLNQSGVKAFNYVLNSPDVRLGEHSETGGLKVTNTDIPAETSDDSPGFQSENLATGNNDNFESESVQTQTGGLQWTLSSHSVCDPSSLPGKILSPFLFNANYAPEFSVDGVKILYNDQTPTKTTSTFGHSKGLILGNSQGGMWIVHSVPHFVDDSQADYSYPHTGLMYGQNFLCLSLNRTELNAVGNNLGYNQIYKYSTHISDANRALYPLLAAVIDGTFKRGGNYFSGDVNTRFNSVAFRTFAKTRELGQDLYANIARDLNSSLLVETWPNGPGRLRSDCKPYRRVENVEQVNATFVGWASTHDHAKWAISFRGAFGNGSKDKESNDNKLAIESGDIGGNIVKDWEDKENKAAKKSADIRGSSIATDTIVEEAPLYKSNAKGPHDDANQLPNELDPLPEVLNDSPETPDEFNTELSDAEEGASSEDEMGEMERIVHRLLNRRYDLDTNRNLDAVDENEPDVKSDGPSDGNSFSSGGDGPKTVDGKRRTRSVGMDQLGHSINEVNSVGNLFGQNLPLNFERTLDLNEETLGLGVKTSGLNEGTLDLTEELLDLHGKTSDLNKETSDLNKETSNLNVKTSDLNEKSSESNVPTGKPLSTGDHHFVCNGDINRAEDQLARGGGSVCIDNEALWSLYDRLVTLAEPCPTG